MSARGKPAENGTFEIDDYMRKPVIKSRWETVRDGCYNPSEGTILGKTGKQWGITGLFYLCFFSGLAVLFAICMKGLLATLPENEPRYMLDRSLIGTNPGLGFRPIAEDQRALIAYRARNSSDVELWVERLNKFLANYMHSSKSPTARPNRTPCSYERPKVTEGHVCAVNIDQDFGACSPKEQYGFNNSQPCIFIKLNKIYGWIPEFYNSTKDLPPEMPEDLVYHISKINSTQLNTVWVSCNGTYGSDREVIGPLKYFPESRGFPGYYYPYRNTPGYLSPLVAVHFLRPERHQKIDVTCRAWAKNIKHDRFENLGMTRFELLVD